MQQGQVKVQQIIWIHLEQCKQVSSDSWQNMQNLLFWFVAKRSRPTIQVRWCTFKRFMVQVRCLTQVRFDWEIHGNTVSSKDSVGSKFCRALASFTMTRRVAWMMWDVCCALGVLEPPQRQSAKANKACTSCPSSMAERSLRESALVARYRGKYQSGKQEKQIAVSFPSTVPSFGNLSTFTQGVNCLPIMLRAFALCTFEKFQLFGQLQACGRRKLKIMQNCCKAHELVLVMSEP